MARILTGIQSSGRQHLGNVLGAILPAIELAKDPSNESYLFIADLHSLTTVKDPEARKANLLATAAAWLACGLDPERTVFYAQSDLPECTELTWYLNCFTPYPMLANAHSFKDKSDRLSDVNAGLFDYPVLMAIGTLLTFLVLFSGCGSSDPIRKPSFSNMARPAPDSFDVSMSTSSGDIGIRFYRAWSPLGVDRAFYLFKNNFYEGTRFYRVVDDFVAQFGGSGDAEVDSIWRSMNINDEPVLAPNKKGTISYARSGARTRNNTMYINLKDNLRLDSLDTGGVVGYPPIGRVISGWDVVENLYSGYGNNVSQRDLTAATLSREFPRLDSISATSVTRMY